MKHPILCTEIAITGIDPTWPEGKAGTALRRLDIQLKGTCVRIQRTSTANPLFWTRLGRGRAYAFENDQERLIADPILNFAVEYAATERAVYLLLIIFCSVVDEIPLNKILFARDLGTDRNVLDRLVARGWLRALGDAELHSSPTRLYLSGLCSGLYCVREDRYPRLRALATRLRKIDNQRFVFNDYISAMIQFSPVTAALLADLEDDTGNVLN